MMCIQKLKRFLRRGDGNTLAFVCIMIGICMSFLFVTAFFQLYISLNSLSEAASVVSRAVAITPGYDEALLKGKDVAKQALKGSPVSDVDVNIELIDKDGNKVDAEGKNWTGGNYAKVTVSANVRTLDPYVSSGPRSRSLVTMIEAGSMIITKEQILACNSREEYLDLVLPVYKYYCDMYGVPYPGLIAIMSIYENSMPHPSAKSVAFYNGNNMAGLKVGAAYRYGLGTIGHNVNDGTGGTYLYFRDCSESIEAIVYTLSAGYTEFFNCNAHDFITGVAYKWIGTGSSYAPMVYADYLRYGLEARGY